MKKLSFYLIASFLFVSCLSKQNEKTISIETQEIKTSKLPLNLFPPNGHKTKALDTASAQDPESKEDTSFLADRDLSNVSTPRYCPNIWGTHRCVSWKRNGQEKLVDNAEYWYKLSLSPNRNLRGYVFEYQGAESTQHSRDKDAFVRRADAPTLQIHRYENDFYGQSNKTEFIPDSSPRDLHYEGSPYKYKGKCIAGNLVILTFNPNNTYMLEIIYPPTASKGDFRTHAFYAEDSNVPSQKEYFKKLSTAWKNFDQQIDFPSSPEGQERITTQCFKL